MFVKVGESIVNLELVKEMRAMEHLNDLYIKVYYTDNSDSVIEVKNPQNILNYIVDLTKGDE